MDAFPLAPEVLKAFPVGTLGLLVAVASTVAAEHGPENARRLCAELAANDTLWAYITNRLGHAAIDHRDFGEALSEESAVKLEAAGPQVDLEPADVAPDTERGGPPGGGGDIEG